MNTKENVNNTPKDKDIFIKTEKKQKKQKEKEKEKETEKEKKQKDTPNTSEIKNEENIINDKKTDESFLKRWIPQWDEVESHFKKNITTWIAFGISIAIIAKDNLFKGILTFLVMLFLVYIIHYEAHYERNWLTISHHYHHENNNFFSHGIQILLEMHFGLFFPVVNQYCMSNILDRWTIILLYLIYTTLHNINYSILHINKTHELHHKNIMTNMGPDICDIIGRTKNQTIKDTDEYIEDTSHYIPNIILCTMVVALLKYLYENPIYRLMIDTFGMATFATISVIIAISNSYLLFFYKDPHTTNTKEAYDMEDETNDININTYDIESVSSDDTIKSTKEVGTCTTED